MRDNPKDSEARSMGSPAFSRVFVKLFISLMLFISATYFFYAAKLMISLRSSHQELLAITSRHLLRPWDPINATSIAATAPSSSVAEEKTSLKHIVFGIAASANLWQSRKNYIKQWWRTSEMRGIVWLDKPVQLDSEDAESLPPWKISSDTSQFIYLNQYGHRSAIRLSRVVSETLRLGMEDVRWFVMGDDDTLFFPENLVRVLAKYDHNQFYYIGSSSETHLQNIFFSYGMAYGGGGIAISYPLAVALEKIQDQCIQRYPGLYGSDDRLHACMAEFGVPLTREPGFHQFDLMGNVFGILAAHPITPLISLHHLDIIEPIFPNVGRVQALERLKVPTKLDSAGLMQQSICYDKERAWTLSVSWGYSVQIIRGKLSAREMELPPRTFLNWYRSDDPAGFTFNTRPISTHTCQVPFQYMLSNAIFNEATNQTASEYVRVARMESTCSWPIANPSRIHMVKVYKKPDPDLWNRAPRRNCCRVLPTKKEGTMIIDVGVCRQNEAIQYS